MAGVGLGVFLGSGCPRQRISQPSLAFCGVGPLPSGLVWVVPTVFSLVRRTYGGRRGEVRVIVAGKNREEGGKKGEELPSCPSRLEGSGRGTSFGGGREISSKVQFSKLLALLV